MKGKYRCTNCGTEAEINWDTKEITIRFKFTPQLGDLSRTIGRGPPPQLALSFPSHADCELAKPIDRIDRLKLEVLEETHHEL